MDAIKMLDTMKRICKKSSGCSECILDEICYGGTLAAREDFDSKSFVESIEKWEQDHPLKTRLQDFIEKNPNVDERVVMVNPSNLGYCGKRTTCEGCKYHLKSLKICWNLPLDEEVD